MDKNYTPWTQVGYWTIGSQEHPALVQIPWVASSSWYKCKITAGITARISMFKFMAMHAANNAESAVKVLQAGKYDPPLVRFHCEGCDHTWDAWVNDDGSLQDQRDVACADQRCPRFGKAAELSAE